MTQDTERLRTINRLLDPVPSYDGPGEIRPFAEYLAPIGEVVIAFSRLERRLTWATESALRIRSVDADAIQETIISVSTRINLFATIANPHVADSPDLARELARIIEQLHKANLYRNEILHGAWVGTQALFGENGEVESAGALKDKYAQLGAKSQVSKSRSHSVQEMRKSACSMLDLCTAIQRWVLNVFPHAENRVP